MEWSKCWGIPERVRIASMGVVLATLLAAPSAHAQTPAAPAVRSVSEFAALVGRWVRPDGGYVVTIRGVGTDGTLDAAYANPTPLPFAKAEASREEETIRVFLELRAGGYDGSTYTLRYDPASDRLVGVYFQAVAQQKFPIFFERAAP